MKFVTDTNERLKAGVSRCDFEKLLHFCESDLSINFIQGLLPCAFLEPLVIASLHMIGEGHETFRIATKTA